MDIVDIVSMLLALVVSGAYLCRLAALNWKQHAPLVIVMHAGVGLAAMLSGVHAWMGNTDVQDVAVLLGGGAWIVLSLHSWRGGEVPRQFRTAPAPLDEATTIVTPE